MSFKILHRSSKSRARVGKIITEHGVFTTPVFMPPGTKGAVKAIAPDDLQKIEAEIILVNALHLFLRPGSATIKKLGGIHKFMNWNKPILSDSGGFQVWSFNQKAPALGTTVSEEGVWFRSPLDGTKFFLSPEKSIEIQYEIGTDIIMAFDECAPDNSDKEVIRKSMERTHRWARRSLQRHLELYNHSSHKPLFFGIAQGGPFEDLRRESISFMSSLKIDGIALGGETIGYNIPATLNLLDSVVDVLPPDKPLYTMGLGASPRDIIEVIKRGVDMFDCVNPARVARHGELYEGKVTIVNKEIRFESEFRDGLLKIGNSRFAEDDNPIDSECDCYTCQHFSRAYLHYLYLTKEPLYLRLATIHNLRFIMRLVNKLRQAIIEDNI
ncbi:tRNA guanosine(34) transglycosylase Tgt [bacterium]|nr:tRNA guanosine(34) transglycosylase Tgt [bacterium]